MLWANEADVTEDLIIKAPHTVSSLMVGWMASLLELAILANRVKVLLEATCLWLDSRNQVEERKVWYRSYWPCHSRNGLAVSALAPVSVSAHFGTNNSRQVSKARKRNPDHADWKGKSSPSQFRRQCGLTDRKPQGTCTEKCWNKLSRSQNNSVLFLLEENNQKHKLWDLYPPNHTMSLPGNGGVCLPVCVCVRAVLLCTVAPQNSL